ncbi:MAG: transglycosylase SLT domain-containing protein [Nitrospirota bacterium]|jgi:soluble lytic murein transglycosylase
MKRIPLLILSIAIFAISCSTKTVVKQDAAESKAAKAEAVEVKPPAAGSAVVRCHYPAACFNAALKEYKEGRGVEAVRELLELIKEHPDSIWRKRSLFLIGKIYKEASNPLAEEYLKAAAKEYEELRDYALYFLAEYYISKEYYTHAVENYDAIIKSFPYSPLITRAVYKKAEANLAGGYLFQAKEGFKEFLKRSPANGLAPNAIYKIAEANEKEGNDANAAEYYRRVISEYAYHSLAQNAEERLSELRSRNPNISGLSTEELYVKANSLYKYPLFERAVPELQKLLVLLPKERHGEILQKLGVALFRTGRTDEAIAVFARIVSQPVSNNAGAEALIWLGRCYARLGDDENQIKSYNAILKRYSGSEWADDALFAMGDYYTSKGDFKKAIAFYSRLAEEFPESAFSENAQWYTGWLNYRSGKYKEAIVRFNDFLDKYPQSEYINRVMYWKGRASERLGRLNSAATMYQSVCRTQFGFYCYNVKTRNGNNNPDAGQQVVSINNEIIERKEAVITNNNAIDGETNFIRARELSVFGMNEDAINELYKLMERVSFNKASLLMINKALYDLGEYHRSVKNIIQNFYDKTERGGSDLPDYFWELAYPQGYWPIANEYAKRYNLDPYLVLAIMREESWFDKQAVSRSGARGVMQLMPFTARWVSKQLRQDYKNDENLFDADININFGAWYLSYLKKRFNGNIVLMTAAYNAGPEAVTRWINGNGNGDTDEFIEAIPYNETKGYVKRVLRSYAEYHRIYNNSTMMWNRTIGDYTVNEK